EEELRKKAARIEQSKSIRGPVKPSQIRSPSRSRSTAHDIFDMDDFELDKDLDVKEEDSRSTTNFLSYGSDFDEKTSDSSENAESSALDSEHTGTFDRFGFRSIPESF
ncbi:hypothetical protein BVRB_024680, partial [Beta vulgaris subsp. vulgaris]